MSENTQPRASLATAVAHLAETASSPTKNAKMADKPDQIIYGRGQWRIITKMFVDDAAFKAWLEDAIAQLILDKLDDDDGEVEIEVEVE